MKLSFLMAFLPRSVFVLFLMAPTCSNAQLDEIPKLYAGLGYYRHTSFDDDSYYHVRVGAQILSYKFVSPEIDFTYYFGGNERVVRSDLETGFPTSVVFRVFRGLIWGAALKLFYGDEDLRLVVIPKYHFGKVTSEGLLSTSANNRIPKKNAMAILNYWSFSIGMEGVLNAERFKIGAYLVYTGFDAGRAMNQIEFPSEGFTGSSIETSTLGLNVRVLYSLWKVEK
ncbi:hypothetical protein MNBD_BACTEROID03-1283 [hydrothermal vent metagenome]|uniref:Outer membrane protein beta-barrel domain-containing protein n=1 Tax=hydrothermal vent metagenome TaxID=652676 RepID=A0A3B0TDM6_9ZZZZ